MMTIARFNWPLYVAATLVLIGSLLVFVTMSGNEARIISGCAFVGASYFVFGSLGVSHYVYDRSDLYRWKWLNRALPDVVGGKYVFCHSGFDEASVSLREKLSENEWIVLDHYDPHQMTEASIQRARHLFPPASGTITAPYNQWPVPSASADVIFGLLAIHELRTDAERSKWFGEAKRCLRRRGRVVLVEHTRDLANFLAFGPGFLHFHSTATWRRCWERSGLRALTEFQLTPWVRVFVLEVS